MHLVFVTKNVPKLSTKVIKIFIISRLAKRNYAVLSAKVARLSVLGAYIEI